MSTSTIHKASKKCWEKYNKEKKEYESDEKVREDYQNHIYQIYTKNFGIIKVKIHGYGQDEIDVIVAENTTLPLMDPERADPMHERKYGLLYKEGESIFLNSDQILAVKI